MFQHIDKTDFPPLKPTLVYDGKCGFCRYWVLKWKMIADHNVDFYPFQEVASNYKDIPAFHFKEAVRFIEPDGKVYSGPDAAFRSYLYGKRNLLIYRFYQKNRVFKKCCDRVYQWVADYRNFVFRLCKFTIGKNPVKPDYSKSIYTLMGILALILAASLF